MANMVQLFEKNKYGEVDLNYNRMGTHQQKEKRRLKEEKENFYWIFSITHLNLKYNF